MTSWHRLTKMSAPLSIAALATLVLVLGSFQTHIFSEEPADPAPAASTKENEAPEAAPAEVPSAPEPPAAEPKDAAPAPESPSKASEEPKQQDPPATTPQDPSAATPSDTAPKTEDTPPLPPKPAEANVLDSVIPPPKPETPEEPAAEEQPTTMEQGEPEPPKSLEAPDSQPTPPEIDLPPDLQAAMDDFMADQTEPKKLQFVFRYQPWEKVIQWFADEADLSLIMDAPPSGTFNYTDSRSYTPAEAIDLLNGVLLTKGYTLIRRDRMLMLINLEDGIPPELVTTIPLEDLENRGEFELVGVLFQLDKFDPEEASKEIEKLIGPQGAVVVLPKTKQLHVTETAGRLRTIREVIQRVEDPNGMLSGKLENYEFKNILPDEGLIVLRQLLDIPTDANATEDDTFRFAMDPLGMRLLFSGAPDKIAKAREILEAIDVSTGEGETSKTLEALQLEVYPIAVADPESVLKVMQTLLEGLPGVRLSTDPKTGSLVALARPSDHATIRATIEQMQSEVRRIEVIYLQRVDPQLASIAIKKMFGDSSDDKEKEKNTNAPTVEADPAGRQLIVHGTENQIAQIRVLLGKMGETEFADGPVATGSRIRVLPITGHRAQAALENLRAIWPMISDNPIKEVTPSAIMPSLKPQETIPARVPSMGDESLPDRSEPGLLPPGGIPGLKQRPPHTQPSTSPPNDTSEDRQTSRATNSPFHFAVQTEEATVTPSAEDKPAEGPQGASPASGDEKAPTKPKPPIVISRSPSGLMIASDDLEALDEFERQFNMLTGGMNSERTELNIFYLKHAKATVVAETLTKIIGSGTTGAETADEDSILGQLGGGALGSTVGSLLSLGASTLSPTGALHITPEPRLNALIVEANATDLRTIEEVLKLLDLPESPEEILVNPRARLIPVYNMAADEVAEIVKVVFADKMQGNSNNRNATQQPPSPADFFAAMRGGRGGSRGGSQRGGNSDSASKEEPEKMTIGTDSRSNSLIVFASQTTYEEVQALVEELDAVAGAADDEETQVVTLKGLNPEAMKSALIAIMGENAVSSSASSSDSRSSRTSRSSSTRSGSSGQRTSGMPDDVRRRMEFMRSMMQRGGAPFGGRPGGVSAAPGGSNSGRRSGSTRGGR